MKVLCDFCSVKHCPLDKNINCALFIEGKPKEYKITSDQIGFLAMKIRYSRESGMDWLKVMFPEEFKPKQEYCCVPFGVFAEKNLVSKKNPDLYRLDWYIKPDEKWFMKYCLDCGQKPIPPIDELTDTDKKQEWKHFKTKIRQF